MRMRSQESMFEFEIQENAASFPGLTRRFLLRCDERIPSMLLAHCERNDVKVELLSGSGAWTACLDVSPSDADRVESLIRILKTAQPLPVDRDPLIRRGWALSLYKQGPPKDGSPVWEGTEIGELVNQAKYPKLRDPRAARMELVARTTDFVRFNPEYRDVVTVVWAFSSNPLSRALGEGVASALGVPGEGATKSTSRPIPKAKALMPQEGHLSVTAQDIKLEKPSGATDTVLLVDDVWGSGVTMKAHAAACKSQWGTKKVYALVAAKTYRGN
jgi:hypothetical protein